MARKEQGRSGINSHGKDAIDQDVTLERSTTASLHEHIPTYSMHL